MPEGYTHVRTAKKAAELAGFEPQFPAAFAAGANGPDILFGYEAWKSAENRSLDLPTFGNRIHRERTGAFLRTLIELADTEAKREYVLGFLNHYATDLLVHPYVYACMAQGQPYHQKGGHGYFEIALDSFLHKQDFGRATVDVRHSIPFLTGAARAECVAVLRDAIFRVYGRDIPAEKLSDAFNHLYYIRKWALASPLHIKKAVYRLVEPFLGGKGSITGHCSPARLVGQKPKEKKRLPCPWQNPFTGEECGQNVFELLEEAARHGAAYMLVAQQYWNGKIDFRKLNAAIGCNSYISGVPTAKSMMDF